MYKFSYDYLWPKYDKNANLCYMDTDSFNVHVNTKNIYKDIAEDVKKRFDTSNFELEWPFPKEENKKVIGLMKNELGGQIMNEFVGLTVATCSYLKDNSDEDIKAKDTNKCVIKRKLKSEDYNNCLEAALIEIEKNNIDTDQKIALSANDDKRMQSFDSIKTFALGMNKNLICKKKKNQM